MDLARLMAAAPRTLRHSSERAGECYTLADDVVAAHHPSGEDSGSLTHEGGSISIEPIGGRAPEPGGATGGHVQSGSSRDTIGPVYRSARDDAIAVPTGRALVRFAEDDRAERHRNAIAAAGFELEQVLAYAPQAAWARAASGRITDTLNCLSALEQLPGVEHVEPQLITEAARRDNPGDA